jgi:hypothetical protein
MEALDIELGARSCRKTQESLIRFNLANVSKTRRRPETSDFIIGHGLASLLVSRDSVNPIETEWNPLCVYMYLTCEPDSTSVKPSS